MSKYDVRGSVSYAFSMSISGVNSPEEAEAKFAELVGDMDEPKVFQEELPDLVFDGGYLTLHAPMVRGFEADPEPWEKEDA